MLYSKSYFVALLWVLCTACIAAGQEVYKRSALLMGCDFEIIVVDNSPASAERHLEAAIKEIQRIESLISSWDKESQTSLINQSAGIAPVTIDLELFELIQRSISISHFVDGAFDISFAGLQHLWRFDGSMPKLPSHAEIASSVQWVNYTAIDLDKSDTSVFLPYLEMRLGFGAIGKGYAADRVKHLLLARGMHSGIVNASGDISVWGTQPDGAPWVIALEHPLKNKEVFATLSLENGAVVTSGDYKKFVEFGGKRYAHIIDPRTGVPASGLVSVTVTAPSAEMADAFATSVFVLGKDVGIDRVNQLPGVECLVIDTSGAIFYSENIEIDKLK